ncbi:hypothetical protein Pfo_003184 [Paulownia fortunei]|nr:hypothetical protein Pfo_003184 [Paulownia fortunei]
MEIQSFAENNNGEVDHHGRSPSDECQETVEVVTLEEFSRLLESQPRKWHPGSERRRLIHKVPPQIRLRFGQRSEVLYNPEQVSLGPYHHGKPELRRAEEFKYVCLDRYASGDEKIKCIFYSEVLKKIDIIRDCYAEVTVVEKYDDKALALMMLLDACFIISFMENCTNMTRNNRSDWLDCLGMAASFRFTARDIMVLENQIPFQVIKLLMKLQYEKEEAEELLQRFISRILFLDLNQAKIPRENEDPPIHLLEAFWRVSVEKHNIAPNRRVHNQLTFKFWWPRFLTRRKKKVKNVSYTSCSSVMDLKAKGIHFGPSSSRSLKDITFKSHALYGQLQLPVRYVSDQTHVFFSNLIAYEVSPNSNSKPIVLSYAIFMKLLIQSVEDVKELQEKGILLNRFANQEKVVKMFKELDTFGVADLDIFKDVKRRVEEHCRSKAKTWIADLIYTRFRSPCTAIALFAAAFLLCLTFLQTFFTIRPICCNLLV